MVAKVLQETTSQNPGIEILSTDDDEWKKYSASLLPVRGDTQTSHIPHEECPHMVRTQGCTPVGLTSSPKRIGPYCEQSHPREVKNREGETNQTTMHPGTQEVPGRVGLMIILSTIGTISDTNCNGKLLDVALARARPAIPHSRGTPHEHQDFQHPIQGRSMALIALMSESIDEGLPAYGRVESLLSGREQTTPNIGRDLCRKAINKPGAKTMSNNNKNHGDLPPLPQRAIRGLSSPWSSPNGEPFHTVHLWEFTNLYVLLGEKDWLSLSKYLKGCNLSTLSRQLDIAYYVLSKIRDNSNQSIVVPNLRKLCEEVELNLDSVERSIRGVRFNTRGSLEHLKFPFAMDIYAWRTLCHIVGDGSVTKRKYPALRWIQLPEHQGPMRELFKRLSRPVGGESDQIWYPKALTYAMMGTMPGLTMRDLRTTKFIQNIIDLPPSYRDFKVQFLAAFTDDDAGVTRQTINYFQKSLPKLELVMHLCKQLNYEYSDHPYFDDRDRGVWSFRLLLRGIQSFYNDLNDIQKQYGNDKRLGLWHKSHSLQNIVGNISDKRLEENQLAIVVYECILTILSDHRIRSSKQLREHPSLQPLVENYSGKIFRDRLRLLMSHDLIQEVKKPNGGSYRPKHWFIPLSCDLETLLQKFHTVYGNRTHSQSYERKFITVAMAKEAIARLLARGIKPNPTNTAREGCFSRKQIYERDDLRALFEDDEEEKNI